MLILSLSHAGHDSSAAIADEYEILSAVQTERITRNKGESIFAHAPTIDAALQAAGVTISDIGAVVMMHGRASVECFRWGAWDSLRYGFMRRIGKERHKRTNKFHDIFNPAALLRHVGAPPQADFFICGHHRAHALSALFFTDWDNALLYTADGGGDVTNYSAYDFDLRRSGGELQELYGEGDACYVAHESFPADSVGVVYAGMTGALGFTPLRHEGKLTGLAAYGEPVLFEEMKKSFRVDEAGRVHTPFRNQYAEVDDWAAKLAKKTTRENAAASVQKLLEEMILESLRVYLQKSGARHVGLAGGVFANVTLNRKIAALSQVDEVFIFPAMADDGVAVGGIAQYLLERDGAQAWAEKRRRLPHVYWGGAFDEDIPAVFDGNATCITQEPAQVAKVAAELLAAGSIVALYAGRMEFGPRALGARSILAAATDKDINNTLNQRLSRTEFMPFAPVVLDEDADKVFAVDAANRYAMRFMTITCMVREEWRGKIPAVVHVDGTARPQIVQEDCAPLYAAILRAYKEMTGVPVLINTSFNAHEEPIIHTPQQCLTALQNGRIDYAATPKGIYAAKE